MKLVFSAILFISLSLNLGAQDIQALKEIDRFQKKLNAEFANPEESPLTAEDLKTFKALRFFPVDLKFRVRARIVLTPDSEPFGMKTTTDRLPVYKQYGIVYFEINGTAYHLSVFQNLELIKKEGFEDYLFIPFTDLTSGNESYGGGRYIDLRIPKTDELIIDFNQAYNPYCAYNHRYSCPIPPSENDLNIEVRAGVKAFEQ